MFQQRFFQTWVKSGHEFVKLFFDDGSRVQKHRLIGTPQFYDSETLIVPDVEQPEFISKFVEPSAMFSDEGKDGISAIHIHFEVSVMCTRG